MITGTIPVSNINMMITGTGIYPTGTGTLNFVQAMHNAYGWPTITV